MDRSTHDLISPEILREAPSLACEEMEIDICQALDFSNTSPDFCGNPTFILADTSCIVKGSPGSTPFPSRVESSNKKTSDKFVFPEALDFSTGNVSLPIAPPPPNSPSANDSHLEEELSKEAKRQEELLKQHLEQTAVLTLLESSPSIDMVRRKRPRKIAFHQESNEDEAIPEIQPFEPMSSNSAREAQRRKRTQAAIKSLKKIVPGIGEYSSETEVCEMTAKYVFFLKKKIGLDHEKEFLRSQIL